MSSQTEHKQQNCFKTKQNWILVIGIDNRGFVVHPDRVRGCEVAELGMDE